MADITLTCMYWQCICFGSCLMFYFILTVNVHATSRYVDYDARKKIQPWEKVMHHPLHHIKWLDNAIFMLKALHWTFFLDQHIRVGFNLNAVLSNRVGL